MPGATRRQKVRLTRLPLLPHKRERQAYAAKVWVMRRALGCWKRCRRTNHIGSPEQRTLLLIAIIIRAPACLGQGCSFWLRIVSACLMNASPSLL